MFVTDDLDHVCVKTGLTKTAYRSFPLALQSRAAETTPDLCEAPSEHSEITGGVQPAVLDEPSGAKSKVALRFRQEPRSALLSGLLSQDAGQATGNNATGVRALTVAGAAGGVGATTLAASLARIFSQSGRRVLLVDGAAESLLPLYFGVGQPTSGTAASCSFVPPSELNHGVISVYARGEEAGTERTLWERARDMALVSDQIIVDPSSRFDIRNLSSVAHLSACVVVIQADMRCALQVRNIEKAFAGHGGPLPFYVLNCYQPAFSFHREVLASLSGILRERLCPTPIAFSEAIPQALAEGLTVVDYAPQCAVAQELVRIADWVKQIAAS